LIRAYLPHLFGARDRETIAARYLSRNGDPFLAPIIATVQQAITDLLTEAKPALSELLSPRLRETWTRA
jgi:hypothetical protein